MSDTVRHAMEEFFGALTARDKARAVAAFANDGVFIDPHYPSPTMRGRDEIDRGLSWGLSVMERFGFTIVNYFHSAEGLSGAVEVDTNHTLKAGRNLRFPQIFVVELDDGHFARLQAYEPYGQNGMGAVFLGLERLKQRFRRTDSRDGKSLG